MLLKSIRSRYVAFQADLAAGPVLHITGFPSSGMGPDFAAAVTLDADIAFRVAGLAGLQVSPRLGTVINCPVFLPVCAQRVVGLDFE